MSEAQQCHKLRSLNDQSLVTNLKVSKSQKHFFLKQDFSSKTTLVMRAYFG